MLSRTAASELRRFSPFWRSLGTFGGVRWEGKSGRVICEDDKKEETLWAEDSEYANASPESTESFYVTASCKRVKRSQYYSLE